MPNLCITREGYHSYSTY